MPICKKIYKTIKKYDEIVIARHIGPDPDAIASELALRDSIRLTFPNKKVYAVGLGVAKYKYYGNLDHLKEDELINPLLIVLDLPNISRIDGVSFEKYQEVIKIDHHPFEDKMGELEYIDEQSCSTCELIARLIFNSKLKMNNDIARNLYLGIASDSERFLFDNITPETFRIVARIMDNSSFDIKEAYENLYKRPLIETRFQGYIAQNLIVNDSGLAYIKITPEILKEHNVDISAPSNMINSFNFINEILVWIFITYDKNNEIYKVNIRSKGPVINEIANRYNGGGHKMAAGCRIKKETDVDKLLSDLDEECKMFKDQQNVN